ncbi:hypothetical protein HZH66_006143 [Vespula vulgaris]|uniref:Uncharacterized protein n=1 Tax=Vespula vulgaris TaxID=7454 RepID=A0A834K5R3_VESVU|nr:hypothetical protein HZH66_006143 [Vespula vulgaris]
MAPFGAQTRMSAWERTLQSKEVCTDYFMCTVNNFPIITVDTSSHGNWALALHFLKLINSQHCISDYAIFFNTFHVSQNSNFHCKHDAITVLIVFDSKGLKVSEPD